MRLGLLLMQVVFALICSASANLHASEGATACSIEQAGMNQPPVYPESAKDLHVGGLVILLVDTDHCGRVVNVQVESSSKSRDLDDAAMAAVKGWKVFPGAQYGGKPSRLRLPIDFQSDHPSAESASAISPELRRMVIQWKNSQVVEISMNADGTLPGYIPDGLAVSLPNIAENMALLRREGAREKGEEGIEVYSLNTSYGRTYWEYFEKGWLFSPALVRRRLVSDGKKAYWVASWLCEAGQESCAKLVKFLEGFPTQTALPPPPKPPQPLLDEV